MAPVRLRCLRPRSGSGQTVDPDTHGRRGRHDGALGCPVGEAQQGVTAGRQPLQPTLPESEFGLGCQHVPACAVDLPHASQVTVVTARLHEQRQRFLVQAGSARLLSRFSSTIPSTNRAGASTQPSRIVGASVLLTDPRAITGPG